MTEPKKPGDINDAIRQLQEEAAKAQQAKESTDAALADKQNRLNTLLAAQKDLTASRQTYGAGYDKLKRELQSYRDFQTSEKDGLEKVLGRRAAEVGTKAEAMGDERKTLQDDVDAKTTAAAEVNSTRDTAKATAKAKADRSGEIRKLSATVTARVGQLKSRRDEITKADQAGQQALAYWLLTGRDYAAVLDGEPKLVAPDDLEQTLMEALSDQAQAEQTLADAERTSTRRGSELADARKKLDDHIANGEARLRADLAQMTEGDQPNA